MTWDNAACGSLPRAVLQQGLWSSTGGCCALRWVPCAALQVTLAGYGFAFRFCPGGKHVAWREGSRTPHEGTVEFISLDSHKGTGGSGFVGLGLWVWVSLLALLAVLLSRHSHAPRTGFLFGLFTPAS